MSKENITKSLMNNLEIIEKEKESLSPKEIKELQHIEKDYNYSRETLKKLVNTSQEALEPLLNLALDSESPRAFEVLSTMLKNTSEMTEKILDLQKKKNDLSKGQNSESSNGNLTQNNIFVGSTSELQKHLKEYGKES